MKKLLFLLLLIPFLGNSQATFTAPVGYNTGAPTATPSGVGTRWRFDLLTGKKYTWLPGSLSWDEDARGIDQVAGCSAPLYTPGYNQSTFAVNSCTVPELYQWTGAAWVQLNEGAVYTAGTGISIDGSNVISNTAPNVVQELSIAGQDLTLSNGGGTVEIPAGSSLGTGFTSGGGTGTIPSGTVIQAAGVEFASEADPMIFGESTFSGSITSNNGVIFNNTVDFFGDVSFDLSPTFSSGLNAPFFQTSGLNGGIGISADVTDGDEKLNMYVNDATFLTAKADKSIFFLGPVSLVNLTMSERNDIISPATGYVIFCTDATATDSSTGVMQVWNGSVWKNAW